MSEDMGDRGHIPGDRLCRLYERWGKNGLGLMISGNVMVDRHALGEPHNVVIEEDSALEPFQKWAKAGEGAAFWLQINHPGRQSPRFLGKEAVAPSAVPMQLPGKVFATPRALEHAEILGIIHRFAVAARICKQAGFGGVQLHGAHGYLISQFLSPLSNIREDEWGGSPERRRRFLIEVIRAVRTEVGPEFPVGVKLNSADFQRGGFGEDESMVVVAVLEKESIDLLEISGGTYEKPAMTGIPQEKESTRSREAYFLEYAQKVRSHTKLPLMLTGGFRSREGMEEALQSGAVDLIGLARPLALEPEFPRRLLAGENAVSKVAPKKTGVKQLDGLMEVAWFSHQLHRMGEGKEPDPELWPWTVVGKMAWNSISSMFSGG